jgi:hypothetical protein
VLYIAYHSINTCTPVGPRGYFTCTLHYSEAAMTSWNNEPFNGPENYSVTWLRNPFLPIQTSEFAKRPFLMCVNQSGLK